MIGRIGDCAAMPEPVTVVVTCYNLERYVGAAIESVLAQDYGGPVEIIVVDDCSSDQSAGVIQSYPEVACLRTERNRGVLLATVAGIEQAGADLLFFLDGDDLWEPGKLSAAAERFAADPALGFITHDLCYIDSDGKVLDRPSRPQSAMAEVPASAAGEAVRKGILTLDDYVWLGSAFGIRGSVAAIDGFIDFARSLPDPRNTYQDWPLAFWVASMPEVELGYVPAKLFRYRLHQLNHSGDAATAQKAVRNLKRTLNTVDAMKEIARRRELPEAILRLLDERLAFLRYLVDLNSGDRMRAARGFLRSSAHLRRRRVLGKELARFAAIQTLGPEMFARIAGRRRIFRNLRLS